MTAEALEGSSGDGGSLTVNATERIEISGRSRLNGLPSGIFSSTEGTGNAGRLQVTAPELKISNAGEISAATLNEAAQSSGSLEASVRRLLLDQGQITVETFAQAGTGAEISLKDLDVLLLQNNSNISAEAFGSADGGNIQLESRFVLAQPGQDSNITANAIGGSGGNIQIAAQGLYNIAFNDGDLPGQNDITASSEFGLDGAVELDTLELDPTQGTAELPSDVQVPQISQACSPNQATSNFVATGRGGIPLQPGDVMAGDGDLWETIALPSFTTELESMPNRPHFSINTHPSALQVSHSTQSSELVEAQVWTISRRGTIQLMQAPGTLTGPPSATAQTQCSLSGYS